MKLLARISRSRVWRSVFRHQYPDNPRDQTMVVLSSFFLHLHPTKVRKSGVRPSFTWCMGGISCFLFLLEAATGLFLMIYYRPAVEHAYRDVVDLREQVSLGILREVHRWGAHAMVITVVLHMLRVFLTGSYKPPREFNWVIGVMLLVLTLLMSFTGYLLPRDQLALCAARVGSGMAGAAPLLGAEGPGSTLIEVGGEPVVSSRSDARFLVLGGDELGGNALLRFYVLHCLAIPVGAGILMGAHFFRIRKDGGISGPL